ncbi:ABC transporter ATP-binding protein [Rhizobium wuzhouense]|uniref:ABC transporter ATP-binding protein n=1 Tax=Rhizobium wuzhouense TaxID=1986026 RepID=A0ABX5NR87_9HYPH|nr:ABC transporter ATP-binding protein [Rhizobium wuzhouense]PYB72289.1 ABC transporter ATP-binding protein [Rhizobium wuzhouense]
MLDAIPKTAGSSTDIEIAVNGLQAWYGESHVLHDIGFDVKKGEVVTLLGRNGAGKTTTLRALMGLVNRRDGSAVICGEQTIKYPSRRIARLGIGYVPEERGIFSELSVEENLMLPPKLRDGGFSREEIFDLFPNLKSRLHSQGTKLSGGEQQMLAMARVLRTGADCLFLDEPTEGLAPVIVQQIERVLQMLKARGFTIILVEQNLRFAASLADRHYVVEQGRIVAQASGADGIDSLTRYLGV